MRCIVRTRYARKLADHKSSAVAQLLVFEVAMRRGKLLQALRALRTAASASADGFSDPKVFVAKMQFITQAEAKLAAPSTSASVQAVVREELAGDDLLAGSTAAQVVDGFVASKSGSLPHRIAAAEALVRWLCVCRVLCVVSVHASCAGALVVSPACVCACFLCLCGCAFFNAPVLDTYWWSVN